MQGRPMGRTGRVTTLALLAVNTPIRPSVSPDQAHPRRSPTTAPSNGSSNNTSRNGANSSCSHRHLSARGVSQILRCVHPQSGIRFPCTSLRSSGKAGP